MAIKYVVIPEKKQTIGILRNCEFDAVNRIEKLMGDGFHLCDIRKYMMPHTFKATVTCYPGDEYDEEEGKRRVKQKLMNNYHKSIDKRIDIFRAELIAMNSRVFETPEVLKNNT
jgi:hypothetical protein